MSTEHEGGYAGSERPGPTGGEPAGPSPDAPERAVPSAVADAAADDTIVRSAQQGPSDSVGPVEPAQPTSEPLDAARPNLGQPEAGRPVGSTEDTVAFGHGGVEPPADPTLVGFPPPVVQPPAAPQDAAPHDSAPQAVAPQDSAPQFAAPESAAPQPAGEPTVQQPVVPSAPVQQSIAGHDLPPAPAVPPAPPAPGYGEYQQPAAGGEHPQASEAPAFPPPPQEVPSSAPGATAYSEQQAFHAEQQPAYGGQGGQQPPYGQAPQGAGWPGGPYGQFQGYQQAPKKKRRGVLIAVLAATAIIAGAIGGGIGASLTDNDNGSTTVSSSVDPKALSRAPSSIAGIAARALPSVVTISASNSQESGTGTGFVFDTQGHILTNNHVVAPSDNGGKLSVKFSDGSSYPATIVGRAEGYDVAVIKLSQTPKKPLVPLALGNSDQVAVGDTTIAIGAPFGLSGTVTSGIISAKNRPVASGDETGAQTSYMNALQTDASINPGNSGGPLMNSSGQVVGIDSAIQSTGSDSETGTQSGSIGLGFAIPINQAKWVAEQLIKTGQPVYPIIGVLRDDSYTGNGAKIASAPVQGTAPVTAGGPAAKAGLQAGDIITQLDGIQIDSGPTLVSEIWSHHPGDVVSVIYTRDGKSHTTSLTLGSRTGDQ